MDARQIERELEFAGEMALEGLWREALFRWEKVLPHVEADARLLNNIAVAREAVGDVEGAREAYDRATELAVEKEIETNRSLFLAAQARLEEDETAPPVEDDEGAGE
jgi:Flp pilus assembly protein TadD